MTSGIYHIKNIITLQKYFGSSNNIEGRWKNHKTFLRGNRHSNKKLQSSWNKYKEVSFEFKIIEECNTDNLLILEQSYLDGICKEDYNLQLIAGRGPPNFKLNKKTVLEIKNKLILDIPYDILCKQYKLSESTIRAIICGDRWKEVGAELNSLINNKRYNKSDSKLFKLSDLQVIEIKKELLNGIGPIAIAKKYFVGYSTICDILRLRTWSNIGSEYNERLLKIPDLRKPISKEIKKKIKKDLKQLSFKEVSSKYNISLGMVAKIKYNLK